MSMSSPCCSALSVLNARLSECAIVPRFLSSSSLVMPMPLSDTVTVRASLSNDTRIARSSLPTSTSLSVKLRKYSLSTASDALETSSRRKISRLV